MDLDFSEFIENVKSVLEADQLVQATFRESLKDAYQKAQIAEEFRGAIADIAASAQEVGRQISNAAKPLRAAAKLGDAQFVYWEYLDDDFVEDILTQEDINCVLQKRFCSNDSSAFFEIANKCLSYKSMDNYRYIFKQCINAFQGDNKEIAIIGLCAVVDGLLSDISGDSTHNIMQRYKEILEQLEKEDAASIDNKEVAFFILITTYNRTIDTYSAFSKFSLEEPDDLNRNWIMHGRSRRRITELDCLKILNMVYGLLLMDDAIYKKDDGKETSLT